MNNGYNNRFFFESTFFIRCGNSLTTIALCVGETILAVLMSSETCLRMFKWRSDIQLEQINKTLISAFVTKPPLKSGEYKFLETYFKGPNDVEHALHLNSSLVRNLHGNWHYLIRYSS